MISPSERNTSIDVIRIVGMLMVLVLHTFRNFVERPDFFATPLYWTLLPVVVFSMPAVLIFFVLSGYLVLPKQRSIRDNFERTVDRLVVPLFFFESLNMLYSFGTIWSMGVPLDTSLITFITHELERITRFPSSPLWFLYVLIGFYLLNPLLQPIFSQNKKRLAQYVTILAFSLPFLVVLLEYPAGRYDQIWTNFTGWITCVFYYLYGGLLAKGWGVQLKTRQWVGVVFIALTCHVGADYVWNLSGQAITGVYFWLLQIVWFLSPLLIALSIVHILLSIDWSKIFRGARTYNVWAKATAFLATLSFGVYLVHPILIDPVIRYWAGWYFDNSGMHPALWNILNFGLVLVGSVLLTLAVRKIPYLRKVIGEPAKIAKN